MSKINKSITVSINTRKGKLSARYGVNGWDVTNEDTGEYVIGGLTDGQLRNFMVFAESL